jgi:hypothetical protein
MVLLISATRKRRQGLKAIPFETLYGTSLLVPQRRKITTFLAAGRARARRPHMFEKQELFAFTNAVTLSLLHPERGGETSRAAGR